MRLSRLLPPAALALAGALAACADTAPTAAPPAAPSLATVSYSADTTITKFTYEYRTGTTQQLGHHKVVLPALSVCDPAGAGYGADKWDAPCTALRSNLEITALTWTKADGHPQVQFLPDLRFVPTTDSRQYVKLFFKDKDASSATLAAALKIDWVPYIGAAPIDESADPTLKVQVSPEAGVVWRRVKHFSGYSVGVGRTSDGY